MAAHFRACRARRQPVQTGAARTRSSSDFKAMPAAKAASRSPGSRPRDSAQPGMRGKGDAVAGTGMTRESMPGRLQHPCGLCHLIRIKPHSLSNCHNDG